MNAITPNHLAAADEPGKPLSVFQILALLFLAALIALELVNRLRAPPPSRIWLLRLIVWLAAALTIAWPGLTQKFADAIGIGRGADVVLYIFVLAFLVTTFYWYFRHVQLQRQLTEVVRHIALREAERGRPTQPSTPD
jgi:hypothetical protein